jgi:hypothetical protein
MAVVVIAGSGSGAGKTAVGCALIAALPELRWVAVKISPHAHQGSEPAPIWEETDRSSHKDTGRYLAAGAVQALLVSGLDADATARIWDTMRASPSSLSLMVESNRIEPDLVSRADEPRLSLAILAGPEVDWKASIWSRLVSADALVLAAGLTPEQLSPELQDKRIFGLPTGRWMTPELVIFVRESLRVQGIGEGAVLSNDLC